MLFIILLYNFILFSYSIQLARATNQHTIEVQATSIPQVKDTGPWAFVKRQANSSISNTLGRSTSTSTNSPLRSTTTTQIPTTTTALESSKVLSVPSSASSTTKISTTATSKTSSVTPTMSSTDTGVSGGSTTTTTATTATTATTTDKPPVTTTTTANTKSVDDGGTSTTATVNTNTTTTTTTTTTTPAPPPPPTTTSTTSTSTSSPAAAATCSRGFFLCDASFGGGCCQTGYACATSKCIAPLPTYTPPPIVTCEANSFLCPEDAGGGCCPNGRRCGQTICEAIATTIITQRPVTITLPPVITTVDNGGVVTHTPAPVTTTQWETYTAPPDTIIITKGIEITTFVPQGPRVSEVPQIAPSPQEVSNTRALGGGAVGGIIGGSIIALVVLLSAVIFTWKRLTGRGNFELPHAFGAGAFRAKKHGRGDSNGDSAITSASYDPQSPAAKVYREKGLKDFKFGRSGSGSSGHGGGYRGANVRGGEGYYPGGGTTIAASEGKSASSVPRVTVNPTSSPGTSPYERDGFAIPQHPQAHNGYEEPYLAELPDGSNSAHQQLPRWQVTNPDPEPGTFPPEYEINRPPLRIHSGTNF